eukprot:720053-Pelagomonas_calceolata.AAC.5
MEHSTAEQKEAQHSRVTQPSTAEQQTQPSTAERRGPAQQSYAAEHNGATQPRTAKRFSPAQLSNASQPNQSSSLASWHFTMGKLGFIQLNDRNFSTKCVITKLSAPASRSVQRRSTDLANPYKESPVHPHSRPVPMKSSFTTIFSHPYKLPAVKHAPAA